jgi:hypothetical protein
VDVKLLLQSHSSECSSLVWGGQGNESIFNVCEPMRIANEFGSGSVRISQEGPTH